GAAAGTLGVPGEAYLRILRWRACAGGGPGGRTPPGGPGGRPPPEPLATETPAAENPATGTSSAGPFAAVPLDPAGAPLETGGAWNGSVSMGPGPPARPRSGSPGRTWPRLLRASSGRRAVGDRASGRPAALRAGLLRQRVYAGARNFGDRWCNQPATVLLSQCLPCLKKIFVQNGGKSTGLVSAGASVKPGAPPGFQRRPGHASGEGPAAPGIPGEREREHK